MSFPQNRMRRLRRTETLRRMVRETQLTVNDLIAPLFVVSGTGVRKDIGSMPGVAQMSADVLVEECRRLEGLGIPAVILFGIPDRKDAIGSDTWNPEGIVQRSVAAIKRACRTLHVITDVCFCEYTDHGHCGVIVTHRDGGQELDNDATLANLAKQVVSHARAGADMVAPSGMIDGMIGTIREALDEAGFADLPVMSYAAKYASGYYGPFRDAAESTPQWGRPPRLPDGPGQRGRGNPRGGLGCRGGRGPAHGEAGGELPGHSLARQTGVRPPDGGVSRERRIFHDQGRGAERVAR